jgi:hypothetical protein
MAYATPELSLVGRAASMVLGIAPKTGTSIYLEGDETYSERDVLFGKEDNW